MQVAEQHLADSAAMRQPLRRVTGREAEPFGRAVIFMDDRAPPFDHLLFHLHGAGGRGVDGDFERREVVFLAHVLRQFEHAREHGRHELRVRDLVLLDELQIVLGIEALHHDHFRAFGDREIDRGLRRGMVERRRREVDHVLAIAPELVEKFEQRKTLFRRLLGQGAQDAFRTAGRARGIEHRRAQVLIRDRRRGKVFRRLLEVQHLAAVAGPIDDQCQLDLRAAFQGLHRDFALGLRGDDDLGLAIVDDIGELFRRQEGIDAREIIAGTFADAAAFRISSVVLHEDGIMIEALHAMRAQEMREAILPRLEFAICDCFAGRSHDDGRLVGLRRGVDAWIHLLLP